MLLATTNNQRPSIYLALFTTATDKQIISKNTLQETQSYSQRLSYFSEIRGLEL